MFMERNDPYGNLVFDIVTYVAELCLSVSDKLGRQFPWFVVADTTAIV